MTSRRAAPGTGRPEGDDPGAGARGSPDGAVHPDRAGTTVPVRRSIQRSRGAAPAGAAPGSATADPNPLPPGTLRSAAGAAPALRRGLEVLRLLASRAVPVSAGAIARELGLPRSTTYELLTELAAAGFAVHLPAERRWGLGLGAFEIGSAYLRGEPLERAGRPVLARLCQRTGGTVHLGVLHGAETLYLAKDRARAVGPTLVTEVGVRLPAALTATGLSILAQLPPDQVRALFPGRSSFVDRTGRGPAALPDLRGDLARVRTRGWAVEDGRISVGTASVAAPVFDHNGVPIAAVGVTVGHRCEAPVSDRYNEYGRDNECGRDFSELAGPVRHAAAEVTAAIGGRVPDSGR